MADEGGEVFVDLDFFVPGYPKADEVLLFICWIDCADFDLCSIGLRVV